VPKALAGISVRAAHDLMGKGHVSSCVCDLVNRCRSIFLLTFDGRKPYYSRARKNMQPEIIVVPTVFGVFGWTVWTITTNIRRAKTARIVADLHGKFLEKCSVSQDLMGYVQSDAGRRFLESAANEQTNPAARILNAIQAGTILSLLGGALIIVSNLHHEVEAQEILVTLGYLVLALGLGFLVSAAISYGLCRSWGLLQQADAKI
jgi:hypothetical protein